MVKSFESLIIAMLKLNQSIGIIDIFQAVFIIKITNVINVYIVANSL